MKITRRIRAPLHHYSMLAAAGVVGCTNGTLMTTRSTTSRDTAAIDNTERTLSLGEETNDFGVQVKTNRHGDIQAVATGYCRDPSLAPHQGRYSR